MSPRFADISNPLDPTPMWPALLRVAVAATVLLLGLMFYAAPAKALQICKGEFALCAATACTPTGRSITTNNGSTYPEASCICPVLLGAALADVAGGNMQGACTAPDKPGAVWSLFAPRNSFPQATAGWQKATAVLQFCSSSLNLGGQTVNCFSFACTKIPRYVHGVLTADCRCPIGEGVNGPMAAATTFGTMAGQGSPSYCGKYPVSAPIP